MRSRCCVCVCVCVCLCIPPIVARQRLGRNVTAVTNTHATIEELLDASFSCRVKGSRQLVLPRTSCLSDHNEFRAFL
jgi:hypothetical protein